MSSNHGSFALNVITIGFQTASTSCSYRARLRVTAMYVARINRTLGISDVKSDQTCLNIVLVPALGGPRSSSFCILF
jgi:hypothetical protein